MDHFTAHRLTVHGIVVEPVQLNEHKGSALRGALYHSLRNRFCTMRHEKDCADCPLWQVCPVCTLVSTLAPGNRLGRNAARPYTIQPPLDATKTLYRPGEPLSFGLTLYADAMRLFPYVVMALQALQTSGLGKRVEHSDESGKRSWRRGTIRIEKVCAENPLTGEQVDVTRHGDTMVHVPDIPVTHQQVNEHIAQTDWPEEISLDFLTPTRLTSRKRLVKPGSLTFRVLLGRTLDRLESLAQHFCDTPLELDYASLVRAAEAVRTVDDRTRWVELSSYSTRQRRSTPIGGLMGCVTFAAQDWEPFLPWLVWAQFTHVGKDAVKGNGWYRLSVQRDV